MEGWERLVALHRITVYACVAWPFLPKVPKKSKQSRKTNELGRRMHGVTRWAHLPVPMLYNGNVLSCMALYRAVHGIAIVFSIGNALPPSGDVYMI